MNQFSYFGILEHGINKFCHFEILEHPTGKWREVSYSEMHT
jgi:hypothetical protein